MSCRCCESIPDDAAEAFKARHSYLTFGDESRLVELGSHVPIRDCESYEDYLERLLKAYLVARG